MAPTDRITLVIEGLPEDGGRVRLATLMTQLQSFNSTLSRIDKEINQGKSSIYFEVAELSFNSPIRIVLEARQISGRPYFPGALLQVLDDIITAVGGSSDLSSFDADILEDIKKIARPVGKQIRAATLIFKDRDFELTENFAAKIENALAVEEECQGSLDGMLEQINIHSGANTFYIFPGVGPKRVACHFPGRLYDDAVVAVGRRVGVSGILRYRSGADFAHQIAVTNIDVWPPDEHLASWEDIRGRAPEATGLLSSDAFIRELRDAW